MREVPSRRDVAAGIAGSLFVARGAASAVTPSSFYAGKTMTMIVGFAPGGGVDGAARAVARHIVRFIAGDPKIVVQNMEGAAGVVAANFLAQRVAPDGLTIAIPGRSWYVEGVTNGIGVRFDPTKLSYIGSPGAVNSVIYLRSATGIRNVDALKASRKVLSFGALASNTATAMVPAMLAQHGFPIKVVTGYGSSARVVLALEQGEVDGFFTVEETFGLRKDLIAKNIIYVLLQNKPVHPGVPLLKDVLPKSEGTLLDLIMALEGFGLPVAGPPGVPADRLSMLRSAFLAMCRDKDFQDEAVRTGLPVGAPIGGIELAMMMSALKASATPAIIAAYKKLGAPV